VHVSIYFDTAQCVTYNGVDLRDAMMQCNEFCASNIQGGSTAATTIATTAVAHTFTTATTTTTAIFTCC
jgi:hypothetical protein